MRKGINLWQSLFLSSAFHALFQAWVVSFRRKQMDVREYVTCLQQLCSFMVLLIIPKIKIRKQSFRACQRSSN